MSDDEFRDFEAVKETIRQNEARDPDFYAPPDAFTDQQQQAKMPPRSLHEALSRGMTPHEYALDHSDEPVGGRGGAGGVGLSGGGGGGGGGGALGGAGGKGGDSSFTEDDLDMVSDIVHSIGIPAYYFGSDGKVKDEYARLVADRSAAIEHYRNVVAGTSMKVVPHTEDR